jgi:hypothetical protein
MLLARSALLACSCALGACQSMHSEKADQAFTVAIGEGELGSGGLAGFERPWVFSTSYTIEPHDWSCGIETGIQFGSADGPDAVVQRSVELSELWIGAARTWGKGSALRLQAGAGLRFARAEWMGPGFIFDEQIDIDYSMGLYAHVGGFVHVDGPFSIGLDARWADGEDYELEGQSRDALLTQLLLALRWDI